MKKKIAREPINDQIIQQVANEKDLSIKLVKEIVNTQSKFTAEVMRSNLFDSVRWPYFGVFKAKVKQANVLNYMKGLTSVQRKFFSSQKYLQYINKKIKRKKLK